MNEKLKQFWNYKINPITGYKVTLKADIYATRKPLTKKKNG